MSNMSYCRFENTFADLRDCQSALEEEGVKAIEKGASSYEKPYVKKLIDLCKQIAEEYGDEQEDSEEDGKAPELDDKCPDCNCPVQYCECDEE